MTYARIALQFPSDLSWPSTKDQRHVPCSGRIASDSLVFAASDHRVTPLHAADAQIRGQTAVHTAASRSRSQIMHESSAAQVKEDMNALRLHGYFLPLSPAARHWRAYACM